MVCTEKLFFIKLWVGALRLYQTNVPPSFEALASFYELNTGIFLFLMLVSKRCNFIIDPTHQRPAQGTNGKTISKADEASQKRDPVPDKILAKKL